MAVTGEIAKKARARIPMTWDALASDQNRFGDSLLQDRVDSVKYRLFGTVVDPEDESDTYGKLVLDYAGIQVALALITAGAEYWGIQATQHSAVGRNEQKTFSDRAEKMWKVRDELRTEAEALLPLVEAEVGPGVVRARKRTIAVADEGDTDFSVTPDPYGFERPFERPVRVV